MVSIKVMKAIEISQKDSTICEAFLYRTLDERRASSVELGSSSVSVKLKLLRQLKVAKGK